MNPIIRVVCTVLLAGFIVLPAQSQHWPQFRGPNQDAIVPAENRVGKSLPLQWDETKNVTWKTEIPHRGLSGPVIMNNQLWLTTATEEGHELFVLCLDATTGEVLHQEKVFHIDAPRPLGNDVNSYATPTPVLGEGRAYIHFGSYGTAAIDTETFDILWTQTDLPCNHFRGPASSPVLFEDLLILTFDGSDYQYQAALDKHTGEVAWRTDRSTRWKDLDENGQPKADGDFRKAFSTPVLTEHKGEPRMLISASYAAFAYNPRTGEEIWTFEHDAYSNASLALVGDGLYYIFSGRRRPELFAVTPGGTGDIADTHIAWSHDNGMPSMVSAVIVDDYLFIPNHSGVLTSLNKTTGEVSFRDRIGGQYYASPLVSEGLIYFFATDGTTRIFTADFDFLLEEENTLPEGIMATPAVVDGALFIRTDHHVWRIENQE